MAKNITFEQTSWQDCVGGKIHARINSDLGYASQTLYKINACFQNVNEVLKKNVKYKSRENHLRSLKVVVR